MTCRMSGGRGREMVGIEALRTLVRSFNDLGLG